MRVVIPDEASLELTTSTTLHLTRDFSFEDIEVLFTAAVSTADVPEPPATDKPEIVTVFPPVSTLTIGAKSSSTLPKSELV